MVILEARGKLQLLFNGYRVSVLKDDKSSEEGWCNGCKTM